MPTKRSQPEIGCPTGRFEPIFAGKRSGVKFRDGPNQE
jgi:hypothetical protein